MNIGNGIGMGIVLRGELLRGATSMAGMVAHIHKPGPGDDQTCICGNVGCLQTQVTVPALVHRAQRAIADGVLSVLTAPARTRPETLSFDDLIAAARAGEKLALNLFEETGEVLGATVADLIHLFNPSLIIVGGALAGAADQLIDPLRRAARRAALAQMYAAVEIVFSGLRPRAAIPGAGAMVLRRVLEFDPDVSPETAPARGAPNGKSRYHGSSTGNGTHSRGGPGGSGRRGRVRPGGGARIGRSRPPGGRVRAGSRPV